MKIHKIFRLPSDHVHQCEENCPNHSRLCRGGLTCPREVEFVYFIGFYRAYRTRTPSRIINMTIEELSKPGVIPDFAVGCTVLKMAQPATGEQYFVYSLRNDMFMPWIYYKYEPHKWNRKSDKYCPLTPSTNQLDGSFCNWDVVSRAFITHLAVV